MWAGLVHLAVVGKTAYPHRDRPIVVPSGWSLRVEGWGLKTVATGSWGLGRLDAECTLVWAITDYRPSCLLQPNWQDVLRDREHFTHFIFIFISVLFIFFNFYFSLTSFSISFLFVIFFFGWGSKIVIVKWWIWACRYVNLHQFASFHLSPGASRWFCQSAPL